MEFFFCNYLQMVHCRNELWPLEKSTYVWWSTWRRHQIHERSWFEEYDFRKALWGWQVKYL